MKTKGAVSTDAHTEVMIGNFAIARGLVEAGVEIAAAYPGTPSSEILPGIIEWNRREKRGIHAEWSTNERCAFEVAFGAATIGAKAVCMMKQVGLNVAFSSLLQGKRKVMKGGLVIVSCDDPGPQSSQTEQDTRLLAALFSIPVFDPASPKEASDVAYHALEYSYKHKTPVIVRSTHRVSHAREAVPLFPFGTRRVRLDEGIKEISKLKARGRLGIVASGMSYSIAEDVLSGIGAEKDVSLCKAVQVFPVNPDLAGFVKQVDHVLVLEETDSVLEAMIEKGARVFGRRNGYVPSAGELTFDVVREVVETVMIELGMKETAFKPDLSIEEALKDIRIAPRPPKLCAGCPHRSSFYAMKTAFPDAIFPGDIGCYTLGTSLGAVDTCIDMGSGVTLASGFSDTLIQDNALVPIIASIGDSTFFHACLPPLYDAVRHKKKFILVIMDNSTTAMTGMQPTPQSGLAADGSQAYSMKIEDIVRGFGIDFLKIIDPYDMALMIQTIRDAFLYLKESKDAVPAVIIARRECLLLRKLPPDDTYDTIDLEDTCIGCKQCITLFGCPAILFDEAKKKVSVDDGVCVKCGMCLYVCPKHEKGKDLLQFKAKKAKKQKG